MTSHRVRILHLSDLHERGSREAEVLRRRRLGQNRGIRADHGLLRSHPGAPREGAPPPARRPPPLSSPATRERTPPSP